LIPDERSYTSDLMGWDGLADMLSGKKQSFAKFCFSATIDVDYWSRVMGGPYGVFGNYFPLIYLGASEVGFGRVNSFSFLLVAQMSLRSADICIVNQSFAWSSIVE